MRTHIVTFVDHAVRDLLAARGRGDLSASTIEVSSPINPAFGDYSTSVALRLAQALGEPAMAVADSLAADLQHRTSTTGMFEHVEAAPLGFINFTLSTSYLHHQLARLIDEPHHFTHAPIGAGRRVLVEFISANPTGPLTLGNARGAFYGDVLANILSATGHKVEREFYINDAKSSTQIKELGKTALGQGTTYDSEHLQALLRRLKERANFLQLEPAGAGYLVGHEIQLENARFIQEELNIHFDNWFSEEELYESRAAEHVVADLRGRGLVYGKDGAEWLKTTDFGDEHDQVLIRSSGEPTYFLSDIAYHADKFRRGYDWVIDILGADHQGHVKRMEAVGKILGYSGRLDLRFMQLVRLKREGESFKMSKRLGTAMPLEWLTREVGLDVARYFFLTKSRSTHLDFDVELAKKQSVDNPVFYVQYACARIAGIERNASQFSFDVKSLSALTAPAERALLVELIQLPDMLAETVRDGELQRLTTYAWNLANRFHKFYETSRVITDNVSETSARLALVRGTKTILQRVLELLGISAPERMEREAQT
ncbi:arginine--tRNA ligase [Candidatus Parcubacteria bacterium]|nr:arginine--tRNA ligase [Candidatus Parcubacteria bacterium]